MPAINTQKRRQPHTQLTLLELIPWQENTGEWKVGGWDGASVIFQGTLAFDENVMHIQEVTEEVIKYGYLKIIMTG